jgi:hypothetical protein
MNWKNCVRNISILTTFILAACSNTATATAIPTDTNISSTEISSGTATLVIPNTAATAAPSSQTEFCANPYYPVRQGATWTYQSTGSPADDYQFTETITSVRADGFTLSTEYEKFTRAQEWDCSAEGLLALRLGGPVVAALQSQAIQLDLQLKNMSGVTFPHTIAAGDTWQQLFEFEGSVNIAGEEGTASGSAQAIFNAIGTESVTVPAGGFDAMKIEVESLVDLNVAYEGLNVPVTYTATYMYWFAPGIGWVKASGNANMVGQSFTENIELQSYSIP